MQQIISFLFQHWLLFSLFLSVLLAVVLLEIFFLMKGVSKLGVQEAVRWMNETQAKPIDIRSKEAFHKGHVLGSMHFPISSMKPDLQALEIFKNQPILLVCETGMGAELLANRLIKNGYTQVKVLSGGIKAWIRAGIPLEKL